MFDGEAEVGAVAPQVQVGVAPGVQLRAAAERLAGAHAVQVLASLFVELLAVVFQQRQAPPVNAAQRRAQIVRDRVAERFQFPVGRFELDGPVLDTLFQFIVEQAIGRVFLPKLPGVVLAP